MFAQKYLSKKGKKPLLNLSPQKGTRIIVVIPCFYEPDVLQTLISLSASQTPLFPVEVLVVINQSEIETNSIKTFNAETKKKIQNWISKNRIKNITFYVIGPVELSKKWAGAGLARKTGMDEAVLRFDTLENPQGLIVSLDADTLVAKNYFVEIEKHFVKNPRDVGATISFQHQTSDLDKKHLEGIQLYEKYLVYYKNAIQYTGYPYSMFTVGSAFVVTAEAYVRRGGMNRRQAGEDFYFLQNLAQLGPVGEISSTKVFPSARLSDRVPFGTGPILQKWMNNEEDLRKTYNVCAFQDLKSFFDKLPDFYKVSEDEYKGLLPKLPKPVFEFLVSDNFWIELKDVNQNSSNFTNFRKRFFQKFNAFKILKYLNFVHEKFYPKEDLDKQLLLLNEA